MCIVTFDYFLPIIWIQFFELFHELHFGMSIF